MVAPMPAQAPVLIRQQAELQELRHVAFTMLASHDRSFSKQLEKLAPGCNVEVTCPCSFCRVVRPWLPK